MFLLYLLRMANSANIDNEHNDMKVIQDTPLKMVADDRLCFMMRKQDFIFREIFMS